MPNVQHYFGPLEEAIREKLIPAIIGRKVSDVERKLLSLPVRMGGLGIQNPVLTAETEFRNSSIVTKSLTRLIVMEKTSLTNKRNQCLN